MPKTGAVGRLCLLIVKLLAAAILCFPPILFAAQHVPPSFVTPPASVAVPAGQNATFFVVASGSPTLTYQWRFNGADIPGATDTNLVVISAGSSNAGLYSVQVTNAYGTTNSADASLIANYPPIILMHPVSQATLLGSNVAFHVTATGTPAFGYRWEFNGAPVSGGTDETLTISSVQSNNVGAYRAVVTNAGGAVTSLVATLAIVSSPDFLWARNLSNLWVWGDDFYGSIEYGSVAADGLGNVFLAGSFYNMALDFGGITLTNNTGDFSKPVVFLAKYDRWGNLQWAKQAGTEDDWLNYPRMRLHTDSSGDCYLAWRPSIYTNGGSISQSLILAKYDPQGQPIWNKQIAATDPYYYWGFGFAVDAAGNAILSSRYTNIADLGTVTLTNSPAFIAKYDSAGNLLWAQPSPVADAVAFTPSGSVLLTGDRPAYPPTNGVLVKYDSSGNQLWSRAFPHGRAITADAAENIYATGYGNGSYGDITITNVGGGADFFVAKCDTTGQLIWSRQLGSTVEQFGSSIAVDDASNVYVASQSLDALREPVLVFGSTVLTNFFSFLGKYDPTGTPLWGKRLPGWPSELALTDSHQIYLGGRFAYKASFGVFNLADINPWYGGSSDDDVYFVKLDGDADVEPPPPPVPPQIVGPPQSQSVSIGGSRTFGVTAYGGLPLSYQWFFNGTNAVGGATDSAFTLSNAQMANAGNYSVIVTNAYGSATSAVATLTVYPADGGTLSALALFSTNHQVRFNVTGIAGLKYAVQASSNLANWVSLVTNTSPFLFTDPAAGNFDRRYYRSVFVP